MHHVCCDVIINKTFEHLTMFVFNLCYTTWNIKQNNLQKSTLQIAEMKLASTLTGKTNNIKGVFMVRGRAHCPPMEEW